MVDYFHYRGEETQTTLCLSSFNEAGAEDKNSFNENSTMYI